MEQKNNNQMIITVILLIAFIGLVGYLIWDKTNQPAFNQDNSETKIKELESKVQNYEKQLYEKESSNPIIKKSELDELSELLSGSYEYGKELNSDNCQGMSREESYFASYSFNSDQTVTFRKGQNCGGISEGTGKYYFNKNEVIVIDEECIAMQPANCITTFKLQFKDHKLYETKEGFTFELQKAKMIQ